jgi:hypothetical protein
MKQLALLVALSFPMTIIGGDSPQVKDSKEWEKMIQKYENAKHRVKIAEAEAMDVVNSMVKLCESRGMSLGRENNYLDFTCTAKAAPQPVQPPPAQPTPQPPKPTGN